MAPPKQTTGIQLSFTEDRPKQKRITEACGDFEQLIHRLRQIEASRVSDVFLGVNLHDSEGNELGIALAEKVWALFGSDAGHTFIEFSLNGFQLEGYIPVQFEQWEELPKKYFIPVSEAVEVIREWFLTGKLSQDIRWERQSLVPEGN
jgi:predicted transcriptional regulator YdeE